MQLGIAYLCDMQTVQHMEQYDKIKDHHQCGVDELISCWVYQAIIQRLLRPKSLGKT